MSQVTFKTTYQGRPIEVMAGWDHPLQEFFMTVFDHGPDAEEETVWSTIEDPPPDLDQTESLRAKLTEMGIEAPESFWELVERRERNVTHVLTPTGWKSYG